MVVFLPLMGLTRSLGRALRILFVCHAGCGAQPLCAPTSQLWLASAKTLPSELRKCVAVPCCTWAPRGAHLGIFGASSVSQR